MVYGWFLYCIQSLLKTRSTWALILHIFKGFNLSRFELHEYYLWHYIPSIVALFVCQYIWFDLEKMRWIFINYIYILQICRLVSIEELKQFWDLDVCGKYVIQVFIIQTPLKKNWIFYSFILLYWEKLKACFNDFLCCYRDLIC